MRITDLKTHIVNLNFRNAIFLEIHTDVGLTGIAETVMKRRTLSVERSIHDYKRYLIGKCPGEYERHWDHMYRESFWVGGPVHATPISVIDCALWDLFAKSCELPVYRLLGGPTRTKIPAYCHCPAGSAPEEFAANVEACKRRGFQSIKTTLPLFYGKIEDPNRSAYSGVPRRYQNQRETESVNPSEFSRIREFFQAAREAVGPDFGLSLDCHGRLNPKSAVRLCRALEDLDLIFLEEPIPPENPQALRFVRDSTSIPIAAGERWATIHGVRPFLETEAVDILQCDIVNSGGITGMKKIAALAEAHYVSMAPHNPNGPLATAINVHFAAAIPNFLVLETIGSVEDHELFSKVVQGHPVAQQGFFSLPSSGKGYGVELRKESFADFPYTHHPGGR